MEQSAIQNSNALINNTLSHASGGGNSLPRSSRSFGLDLVRAFAIFAVVGGHFFSIHTAFRSTPMAGLSMLIQAAAQSILSCGVPLFIMLTGYLNINKSISRKYYSGIWRVLIAYLFFSVLTLVFRRYVMGEELTIIKAGQSIFAFSSFMYAWYIEMWIGLFLLIPFLNILYKGLDSQKHKQILILTLTALTFLPFFTNRYGMELTPDFWRGIYPLTFYYIGAYIREYQPRPRRLPAIAIVLAIAFIPGLFTMVALPGHTVVQILGDCFGIFGATLSVIVFLLLYKVSCHNSMITNSVYWISLLSLDMYLCCYMFDALLYPWFKERYFVDQSSFGLYFFIIVPMVLLLAFVLSLVKRVLFNSISKVAVSKTKPIGA